MERTTEIADRIAGIKAELSALGQMRPGSISMQKRRWGRTYCQLSYTHRGKGHTEYVRGEDLETVREQLTNYRRFGELTSEWVDLAVESARLRRNQHGEGASPGSSEPAEGEQSR